MAVVFDAASSGSTTGTTLTVSHTIAAGNNRILLVGQGARSNNHTITSMTYAGQAMTLLEELLPVSGWMRLYYLKDPPVGTADIVSVIDQSINHVQASASYSGVDQVTTFDATGTDQDDVGSGTGSLSLTTTKDNDWIVAVVVDNTEVQSAATGTTQRAADGTNMRIGFYDNNVSLTPAGTFSIGFELASPQTWGIIGTTLITVPTTPQILFI